MPDLKLFNGSIDFNLELNILIISFFLFFGWLQISGAQVNHSVTLKHIGGSFCIMSNSRFGIH